jgi:hypothetical protein
MFSNFFSLAHALCMLDNQGYRHAEYLIFTIPRQHERASVLRL